jgi:spermidine synthase
MLSLEDSGKTVGRLYALSTVGSIVGTFSAGFFLIPFVGSTRTLYVISAILIAISLLLAPIAFTRTNFGILILFVLSIAGSETTSYFAWRAVEMRDIDTEYSRVQVFRTTDTTTGRPMRVMATDPYFIQSATYLDGNDLALKYAPFYHLLRHFRPGFRETLMIGGAGYAFPREYLRTYPDAAIDVVEIDPQMTRIAREHFRLQDDPRLKIYHEDGRVFLNRAESGRYDAILLDAFGSLFTIPYQLTTVEAVRNISRLLDEDGVVIVNVGGAIRGPTSKFFQAELATYREVFPYVFVFKVKLQYPDERTQNLMIVACKSECDKTTNPADADVARMLTHRYTADFPLDVPILTDDLAPVEYYNSFAQNSYGR